MRIVFLASSLAPGRSGVGDYIRTLIAELDRLGHPALALGLSDTEDALEDDAPVVRIDRCRPWPQRLLQARAAVAGFAPDWVSLQFVPYAWHPRGYAFGLADRLAPLFKSRRAHLMFHELWVGLNRHDRLVNRLHGILQRRAILALNRTLQPRFIHTHAPAYIATLAAEGIAAGRLPLFGNVPLAPGDRAETRRQLLAEHAPQFDAERAVFAGWFGTIHPEWDGAEAVARLAAAAQAAGRPLVLLSLGRTGSAGAALCATLRRTPPPNSTLIEIGEMPLSDLGRLLAALDLALTPNPAALVAKSSAVASCLEHGLPVLVSRNDWRPRGAIIVPPLDEPQVHLSPPGRPIDLPAVLALRRPPASRLPGVACQFAADLGSRFPVASFRSPVVSPRSPNQP